MTTVSPFIFDGPLPPEDVFGRDSDIAHLIDLGRAGRFVRLYAPRRYGKTSLLRRVAADAPRKRPAMPVVMVDLFGLVSVADLAIRLEAAYRELPDGRWRREIAAALAGSGIGLSLAGVGISAQFAQRATVDPLPALHAILDLPLRAVPEKTRALIIFDEFQAIRDVRGLDGILRSHIQYQRKVASFIFAGSEQGMLEAIFADDTRPLFGQAEPVELTRLAPEILAKVIITKFAETGRDPGDALGPLILAADGHPQRAMLLAHLLWGHTRAKQRATLAAWGPTLDSALLQTRPELETLWERLGVNERRTLRAIANYGSPFKKEAEDLLGLKRSSAQTAVKGLVASSVLEPLDDETDAVSYRIIDPLLRAWIERRFPAL